jgi:hypothetical protein
MPKSKTFIVNLGGTGTQIGTVIGILYPILDPKISDIDMYILDKDVRSGIFKTCGQVQTSYDTIKKYLPFDSPNTSFSLKPNIYQELQEKVKLSDNAEYTIKDLIGEDPLVQDLAAMCWSKEKKEEPFSEGNNRDPSRGSLDVKVCLEKLEDSKLCGGIQTAIGDGSRVRLVLTGGITGGMGSSMIMPLVNKLNKIYNNKLDIDLVLLGTYFGIPHDEKQDEIGSSYESYYRAAAQLEELAGMLRKESSNNWRVYYTAMPGFDNTAGEYKKNGAERRKFHFLELTAALACFDMIDREEGRYQTVLNCKTDKPTVENWDEIPLGKEIKERSINFLRLISVLAIGLLPELNNFAKNNKSNLPFLKKYFRSPVNASTAINRIGADLKSWLNQVRYYVELWKEIQEYTCFGDANNKKTITLINNEKEELERIHKAVSIDLPEYENTWPMYGSDEYTWNNIVMESGKYKRIKEDDLDADIILKDMIADIYAMITKSNKNKED